MAFLLCEDEIRWPRFLSVIEKLAIERRRSVVMFALVSSDDVQGAFLLLVEKALISPEMLGEVGVAGGLCVDEANLTFSIEPLELLLDEGDLWRCSRQSSSVTLAEGRDGGEQSSSNSVNFEVTMLITRRMASVGDDG